MRVDRALFTINIGLFCVSVRALLRECKGSFACVHSTLLRVCKGGVRVDRAFLGAYMGAFSYI